MLWAYPKKRRKVQWGGAWSCTSEIAGRPANPPVITGHPIIAAEVAVVVLIYTRAKAIPFTAIIKELRPELKIHVLQSGSTTLQDMSRTQFRGSMRRMRRSQQQPTQLDHLSADGNSVHKLMSNKSTRFGQLDFSITRTQSAIRASNNSIKPH
jgi:hypothetical protein